MFDINNTIKEKPLVLTLYIKSYLENNEVDKYIKIYKNYQLVLGGKEFHKKNPTDFVYDFNKLIDSFKKKGFDKKYPIRVSKEGVPIDGHHRVACCLYFNCTPSYIVDNNISIKNYNGLDWILNPKSDFYNCFSISDKLEFIKEYNNYNDINYYYKDDYIKYDNLKNSLGQMILNNKKIVITKKCINELSKQNNEIIISFDKKINNKPKVYYKINIIYYFIINRFKKLNKPKVYYRIKKYLKIKKVNNGY